ncbi:MarR family winged helix-turn-helix transcriptional regulator [Subtercola endophyticus]|uniref:MarR family winged helix-turn-helix transcriptional regulator n=1 Tax=Subtercola endophyticus TaxID=2895559 RepID=UPI001E34A287|nr:MarR family winged helix-turn-helix transcriptional regulator [Subtercola endophyticus]UFS58004.1 MarR family winged helix-turn-helix transcriptional regulator [Subtercola endophyticus]
MSTSYQDAFDVRQRRQAELALGVEINALLSAARALTERTAAAFHPGLRPAAFHLARWLYAYGPASPSTLAEAVGMDRSSTSSLVGRMKTLGLVESSSDPVDRRAVTISLTTAGVARVVEATDLRGTAFFARTKDWSVDELQVFTHLLHTFNTTPE